MQTFIYLFILNIFIFLYRCDHILQHWQQQVAINNKNDLILINKIFKA